MTKKEVLIRVTFSYKLTNNIRTSFYVRNLQEKDPMRYRRLALTRLLEIGYQRVDITKIEIMEWLNAKDKV